MHSLYLHLNTQDGRDMFSEAAVTNYKISRRHNPEEHNPQSPPRKAQLLYRAQLCML
jgi:hypothetical protein